MTPIEVAYDYNSRDWPVFPCRAGEEETVDPHTGEIKVLKVKTPYTANGFKSATKIPRIIDRWWADNPDAMTGVPTGAPIGAWVLDIDRKTAPDGTPINGFEALADLEAEHGALPDTLKAATPSGGTHFYFRHAGAVRNRAELGVGIDVRGDGGYVIAPGSETRSGERYEWLNPGTPIADAPQWLLDLVLKHEPPPRDVVAPRVSSNDKYVDAAVQYELDHLASTPMGGGRNTELNKSAFALGTFVGAGALAEHEAREMLRDVARQWGRDWRLCCQTIERGLKAGQQSPRTVPEPAYQPDNDNTRLVDVKRMIENGLAKAKAREEAPDEPEEEPAFRATPFKWIDPATLPRREFAFGTHYIRKYVSVTVSPGGLGKTSNSIVEALAMASGKALTGTKPPERLRVWLFNAEDPRDEMERRIMAACIHYKLRPEDIEGYLFLDSGREQELVIMREDKKAGIVVNEPVVESVVSQIERNRIDVTIVDPFVSTHSVNENDNGAIDKVAKLWAQIADRTNSAVDVVHHLRKMADREASVEDARGAGSLIGAARAVRILNRMSEDQATKAGLEPQDRFSYFWIHNGKANLSPMTSAQHWRKLESVPLGNGRGLTKPQDHVGVVTEWHWPSKEAIAEAVPDEVRKLVVARLGNQEHRESAQSAEWAGYVVAEAMGLPLETNKAMSAEKRRVKAVLDAWIDAGILAIVEEEDPKHFGRKIKFVRPGQAA